MARQSYEFPRDFTWGVAAASAQIEGASKEAGKGESVWDRFSQTPGKIIDGTGTEPACDHYHRFEHDIALMKSLGVKNYRLSIAWPRIYPYGEGAPNEPGLDFYDRLIDALLAAGIKPWVTMFHWDLPQALEDRGGWLNREVTRAFDGYAQTIVKRYSDRVKNWFTLNEMPCFIGLGYEIGIHAPGRKESAAQVNAGYHHALLCHGLGVRAVREWGGHGARVGLVHNPPTPIPVTETEEDIAAARMEYERLTAQLMAPVFQGGYGLSFLQSAGADRPVIEKGDMELIHAPGDFFGLNLYAGSFVRARMEGEKVVPESLPFPKGFPKGDLPWINITPQTLYWAIRHAHDVHGVKNFFISENGMAAADEMNADGEIIDLDRREYLRNYLIGLHRASQEGYSVLGYFLWTWMDNFEWAEGYSKRFGILYNDYETQTRTPKLSAQWYAKVMAENRIV
jgi:beta-glucosidase